MHFRHQRRIERRLRKSTLFAPVSFIEGWAHYCEQMMMDAGLARDDDTLELAQSAEVLVRLARLVVGIKLHTEDMSVEQAVRFFRTQAYLEESSARREAERGTFDPAYGAVCCRPTDAAEASEGCAGTRGIQVLAQIV